MKLLRETQEELDLQFSLTSRALTFEAPEDSPNAIVLTAPKSTLIRKIEGQNAYGCANGTALLTFLKDDVVKHWKSLIVDRPEDSGKTKEFTSEEILQSNRTHSTYQNRELIEDFNSQTHRLRVSSSTVSTGAGHYYSLVLYGDGGGAIFTTNVLSLSNDNGSTSPPKLVPTEYAPSTTCF